MHSKKPPTKRTPNQRQLRVAERVKHFLAEALVRGDVSHPALGHELITVTEVRTSPDLRHATVYIAVLASDERRKQILAALNDTAAGLSKALGRKLTSKHTPKLTFREDKALLEATHIHNILNSKKVRMDLAKPNSHNSD